MRADSIRCIYRQTDLSAPAGKCVLTLGTSAEDAGSGGLDLIPSHSYAVIGKLDLSSSGCSVFQQMLIVCLPQMSERPATGDSSSS